MKSSLLQGGLHDDNDLLEGSDEEDFEFEETTAENIYTTYLERLTHDFDQRKTYEEIILRILNFYQRLP